MAFNRNPFSDLTTKSTGSSSGSPATVTYVPTDPLSVVTSQITPIAASITAQAIAATVAQIPAASTTAPLVDTATAVTGTSTAYARADHSHPLPSYTSLSNRPTLGTASSQNTSYFVQSSTVGQSGGVAALGSDGKVPSSQLPAPSTTVTGVTSVATRTGAVTLTTADVAENSSRLYFTAARVLSTVIGTLSSAATALGVNDTIIVALSKLQAQITALVIPTGSNSIPAQDSTFGNGGVSSNYSRADHSHPSPSYVSLTGRPILGSASALNVPYSGNATSIQVVKGDDTRLTSASSFGDGVRTTPLSGLSLSTSGTIGSGDTVLGALGKIQNQISALPTSSTAANLASPLTNYSSAAGVNTPISSSLSILQAFRNLQTQISSLPTTSTGSTNLSSQLTGYVTGTDTQLSSSTSLLVAFQNLQAQINAKFNLSSYNAAYGTNTAVATGDSIVAAFQKVQAQIDYNKTNIVTSSPTVTSIRVLTQAAYNSLGASLSSTVLYIIVG